MQCRTSPNASPVNGIFGKNSSGMNFYASPCRGEAQRKKEEKEEKGQA